MVRATFLVNCGEKDHKHDAKTASDLKKFPYVLEVIETFIRVKRKEYCMVIHAEGQERSMKKIEKNIGRLENLKTLKRLTMVEDATMPF